ncbi:MAG TPA: quinone oxidoreductase [Trebonia sp.]|nr:quinone oxidoreductase [Trebonia sp.]
MHAIVVSELGGPAVLRPADRPEPVAGPGQVIARVAAAGVNFRDIYERTGVGAYSAPTPYVPGAEGAGTVVAVGPGVTGLAPGSAIAWWNAPGSYAELVAVRAADAVPVPDGADPKTAAAVILQGLTAHYLCHSTFPVTSGTVAVVHAAAGGVGLLLTQMIKHLGGIVVATTSGAAGPDGAGGLKAELARKAGADHVTSYAEFVATVREVTGGRGADVVYDGVGAATFEDSLLALRPRGLMALYGAASGPVPPLDPQRLNSGGSLFLTRPTLGHYVADREELRGRADDLFSWIARGQLDVRIGGEYPLADAARAQEDLAARRTTGKLLLIP